MKRKLLIAAVSLASLLIPKLGTAQVPTASFTASQYTVCPGEVVSLTDASSDSPISWSYTLGTSGNTTTAQNPTVAFATAGSYVITLEATNVNGTSTPFTETITVATSPTLAISGTAAVCEGQSASFTVTGADTYIWSNAATTSVITTPALTMNTVFTATGTSLSGCTDVETINITVNALPSVTASASAPAVCLGSSATLNGSGANTYTWSNSVTDGAPFSPTATATYTLAGTSLAGCTSTNLAQVTISVNALPVISISDYTICSGASLTLAPSGAATYTFNSGSAVVSPVTNTSYSVTGTDANGCVSAASAVSNVQVNSVPVISVNNGTICSGNAFVIVPGGAATYTFSSGSATVTPATTSTYSVTGTSADGCVSSAAAVSSVQVNATPTVAVNSGSICAGNSFTISPSGAVSYTVSGGSLVVNPLATTNYTVNGTSADGCISQNAISNVVVNANPTINVNSGSICSGNSFTIVPSGASTYTISGGTNVVSPASNTSYTVTGISAQGCPALTNAISNVTVNSTPTVLAVSSSTAVCAGRSATLTASGASTYTWNTSATGSSLVVTPTALTSYSVSGTSAQGCISAEVSVNLNVNALPVVSATGGSVCPGGTLVITPAGANNYTIASAASTISGTSATVAPISTTSYTISGIDANGCVSTGTNNAVVSVVALASPNMTIVASPAAVCPGETATLNVSGANTYTWSNSSVGASTTVNPVSQTIYTVVGTGTNVCNGVRTVTVNVNPNPTITVNSGTLCSGYTFTLIPSGAASYTFTSGSNTVNPLTTTSYSVIGTSALGCQALSPAVSTVSVLTSPVISVVSGSVCAGGNFSLSPSGAISYTVAGNTTTNVVSPATTTNYTVTGTDLNGCVSPVAAIATVVAVANPTVNATSASSAVCIGKSTTLTAGGALTYTWSTGSNAQTVTVTPSATTIYTIGGTSAVGCVGFNTVAVGVNALPVVSAATNKTFVCVGENALLNAIGAVTYSWSTGASGTSLTVNPAITSNYTVTGTDAFGCANSAIVSVQVNTNVITTNPSASVCLGSSYTLTANGAVTYTWNGSHLFQNYPVTPVAPTVYTVQGLDANNCLLSKTVSVGVYQLPSVTAGVSSTLVCIGESATLTASGANTYSWSNGTTTASFVITPTINVLFSYVVTGTDNNNCKASATRTVLVDQCTALNKIEGNEQFEAKLFPNPASDRMFVQAPVGSHILLINALGAVVFEADSKDSVTEVSLQNLATGVYFVRLSQLQQSKTIKVVKTN